jgi:hypothetical protein
VVWADFAQGFVGFRRQTSIEKEMLGYSIKSNRPPMNNTLYGKMKKAATFVATFFKSFSA